MRKARAGLITSIMIGLFAVTTAGVSTYAWFQANASATITATGDTTTITVSKPDDYVFYAYKGNKSYDYDGNGVINSSDFSGTPSGTFSNDFCTITSSNLLGLTSFTGMYPGQVYTFAIMLSGVTSAKLDITKIKSNDSSMEGLTQNRYVAGTSDGTLINIGWAIDIYSTTFTPVKNSTPTSYTSYLSNPSSGNSDKFLYGDNTAASAYQRATYLAGEVSSNVVTLSTPIELVNATSLSTSNDLYIFYSVVFLDANTTYFQEVSAATESSGSPTVIDIVPASGKRYFKKSTSGNSNCYGNLSFALNELKIS